MITVHLSYTPISGSPAAVRGVDFNAPLTVTFAAAASTATFTVDGLADAIVEGTEKVRVTLLPAVPSEVFYFIASNSACDVTIKDETPQTVSVAAGASITETGATFFRFTRTPVPVNPGIPLPFFVTFTGLAQRFLDYTITPSFFQFVDFEGTLDVTVLGVPDTLVEGTEDVVASLVPSALYEIDIGSATLDIDDVNSFEVAVTQDRMFIAEEIVNLAQVVLTRSPVPANPLNTLVTVVVGGVATWHVDYETQTPAEVASTATSITVEFAAFASTAVIHVEALTDGLVEGPEEVSFSIVPDFAAFTLGAVSVAELSILDGTPTIISVEASVAEATEGGAPFEFIFKRSPEPQNPVTLTAPFLVTGTATAGTDVTFSDDTITSLGQVTFTDFQTEARLQVSVVNDELVEGIEELTVQLVAAPTDVFYVLDPDKSSATVTIFDDDVFTLSISVSPTQVLEEDALTFTGVFTISRRPVPEFPAPYSVPVTWGGTARMGVDYVVLAGAKEDAGGQWHAEYFSVEEAATVFIGFLDDQALEPEEQLSLALDTPPTSNYVVDPANSIATITITDGDLCGIDGSPCDTFDKCTTDGECFNDVCVGVPIDCEDDDPCTINSCDPGTGCLSIRVTDSDAGCVNQNGMMDVEDDGEMEYILKPLSPDDFRNPFEDMEQQQDLNEGFELMMNMANYTVVDRGVNEVNDPNNQVLNNSGISLVVSLFGVAAMSVALAAGCCIAIVARRNVIDEQKRLQQELDLFDEEDHCEGEWMTG